MNRREARKRVVQLLYQMDMLDEYRLNEIERYDINEFQAKLIDTFLENQIELDQIIAKHLKSWTMNTIGKVEKACLRLAVTELYYIDAIPNKVAMNEAIEMAKTFGDEETYKFVNGVLRTISDDY